MEIARSSNIDPTEYGRFLDRFAGRPGTALAYHHPFYLRFLAGTAYSTGVQRFVSARDQHSNLIGVVPGIHVRTPQLNLWLSLAYFGPNAGAIVPDADSREGAAVVDALLESAQSDARDLECGSMTICTPLNANSEAYRRALGGVDFDVEKTAQCLSIPADVTQSPWSRKVRYDIRRAASLGVVVRPIADERELDRVWDIYRVNCEDGGIPIKAREHMRLLFRSAGGHGIFLLAEHIGEIVAGLICLMGSGVLSYYLPCTRADVRSLQPGLLLLDRVVAVARETGCRLLNFEASPALDNGVYQFKARCGGVPVPYRVLVKLLRPGVLDEYRELTTESLGREAPHAFVVPFEAVTQGVPG